MAAMRVARAPVGHVGPAAQSPFASHAEDDHDEYQDNETYGGNIQPFSWRRFECAEKGLYSAIAEFSFHSASSGVNKAIPTEYDQQVNFAPILALGICGDPISLDRASMYLTVLTW